MPPRDSTGDRDAVLRQMRWCADVQTVELGTAIMLTCVRNLVKIGRAVLEIRSRLRCYADNAPADVLARGPAAVRLYQSACQSSGTRPSYRVSAVVIGRDAAARQRLHHLLSPAAR